MKNATSMIALEGALRRLGPTALAIRCDAPSFDDLQEKLLDLQEQMESMQAAADAESRELTDEEQAEITRLSAEFDRVDADLARRRDIKSRGERLAESFGRRTEPDDAPSDPEVDRQPRNARRETAPRQRAEPQPRNHRLERSWGWQTMGHFAMAVRDASRKGGHVNVDPRLIQNAPTTFGTEGVGEDGGFAVPPEFREAITELVFAEDSLIGRTDQLTSSRNSITLPVDETTPWQSSGGIQGFWEGEGDQLAQSKPNLATRTIRLHKLAALVGITDELLEDAPALDTYLRRKAPEKLDFKVTNAIIDGTGAGQPQGILRAPATITVAKEGSQAADTLLFENISKMYSRMYARCRSRAVWLINQDIEPQLDALNHPGDSSPVFMPPGGLRDAPFGTIKGRPVIPTEACKTLGDKGDIIFADLSSYMTARKTGGVRAETSMHLWFDYDMMAFRFILRVAGMPWWSAAMDRFNGTNTLSCFVTLAERA